MLRLLILLTVPLYVLAASLPNVIWIESCYGNQQYGWTTCNPAVGSAVPGLVIKGNYSLEACTLSVTASTTIPVDVPEYDDAVDSYLSVNPTTGQVFMNGGPDLSSPGSPVGPGVADGYGPEPLVQTYTAQCVDISGVVSNILSFNVSFPSIDVLPTCNADGSCCM